MAGDHRSFRDRRDFLLAERGAGFVYACDPMFVVVPSGRSPGGCMLTQPLAAAHMRARLGLGHAAAVFLVRAGVGMKRSWARSLSRAFVATPVVAARASFRKSNPTRQPVPLKAT